MGVGPTDREGEVPWQAPRSGLAEMSLGRDPFILWDPFQAPRSGRAQSIRVALR